MAIVGLGTDIVEISRMQNLIRKHGDDLALRVLTESEFQHYKTLKFPEKFLAKRFAAKEAAAKALGTGIAKGVSFQHIQIENNELGAPLLSFTDAALSHFTALGGNHTHISISDEKCYAVATVILESL